MPRRCPTGCFNLPCIRKKCPVKDDLRSDEDCPVKNDLSSDDEDCPVGNDLLDLTSEDLCHFTRQFSPENLIGVTHLGKLYRGKMPVDSDATKDVAVKILGHDERLFKYIGDDKLQRLENTELLHLATLMDPFLGAAEFSSFVSIKCITSELVLLSFFDEMVWWTECYPGTYAGLQVPSGIVKERTSWFTVRFDVLAFGVFLLNFISKRVVEQRRMPAKTTPDHDLDMWALKQFKSGRSLVHQSLEGDSSFYPLDGDVIVELAIQCVECESEERPNMKEVGEPLEDLRVVYEHGKEIDAFYTN
ncbi:putative myb-like protein X-like isoform X1 [Capsicum annuum]|nr:putative myb-like protein X-like isoform X1 [Capsicum annuum]